MNFDRSLLSKAIFVSWRNTCLPGVVSPELIYDQRGLKLFETTLSEAVPGTILGKINVNDRLPHGIYIIKAGRTQSLVRKIVIN